MAYRYREPWQLKAGIGLLMCLAWAPITFDGISLNNLILALYGTNAAILFYRAGGSILHAHALWHAPAPVHHRVLDGSFWWRFTKTIADFTISVFCGIFSVLLAPGVVGGALGSYISIVASIGLAVFPYFMRLVRNQQ